MGKMKILKYYLLRHAEREKIGIKERIALAELTEKGKEDAYKLGKFLKNKLKGKVVVYYTPFKRTKQTAEYFGAGYGNVKIIGKDIITKLTDHYDGEEFVKWWDKSEDKFLDYISKAPETEIYEKWFKGELENALPPEVLVKRDLKKIKELEEKEKFDHLIVFCHDSTIAYFNYYFNKEIPKKNPGYLEGIGSNNLKKWEKVIFEI